MSHTRTIEDVMDDMPFMDAEILSAYINHRDERFDSLDEDRKDAIERAMRAEQGMVDLGRRLAQTEAKVIELTGVLTAQQQSITLSQIKLGGIAMLLQGK
jgi:hypothetical protein